MGPSLHDTTRRRIMESTAPVTRNPAAAPPSCSATPAPGACRPGFPSVSRCSSAASVSPGCRAPISIRAFMVAGLRVLPVDGALPSRNSSRQRPRQRTPAVVAGRLGRFRRCNGADRLGLFRMDINPDLEGLSLVSWLYLISPPSRWRRCCATPMRPIVPSASNATMRTTKACGRRPTFPAVARCIVCASSPPWRWPSPRLPARHTGSPRRRLQPLAVAAGGRADRRAGRLPFAGTV